MIFKSKFPRELLNEVRYRGYDLSKCTVYYINRGSHNDIGVVKGEQIIEIGKGFLILEGIPEEKYIPYHRIVRIEYEDVVIFEKPWDIIKILGGEINERIRNKK